MLTQFSFASQEKLSLFLTAIATTQQEHTTQPVIRCTYSGQTFTPIRAANHNKSIPEQIAKFTTLLGSSVLQQWAFPR